MASIIVRRGEYQQYDRLYRAFGDLVPVVWDQRRSNGAPSGGRGPHESHADRRLGHPPSWVALGFVVVDRNVT